MDLLESVNSPLSGVVQRWLSLIEEAKKVKHELFGQFANESAKFFDSVHNFMWSDEYAMSKQGGFLAEDHFGSSGLPTFRMSVNPVSDAVRLFGPALYHRNPNIVVEPKLPPKMDAADLGLDETDPFQAQAAMAVMQQQELTEKRETTTGKLCQHYLNWLQLETDKKDQSRMAINDAIVKGMGILWTEIYQPPNSQIRYPYSTYMSVDDLVKDPDARYRKEVQWIARRCVHPVNLVEEKYGYAPGSLRGTMQSIHSQQSKKSRQDLRNGKRDSKSFDLIEYWEIYSKNGFGQHLKESKKKHDDNLDFDLSVFGKYCYLAVCKDIPFPLNVPPTLTEFSEDGDPAEYDDRLAKAAAWPIPFWEDEGCNNGWPCAELSFYESTDHIWPIPLVKPAIGEIRFVNWVMSFLGDRTAASCKNYLAVAKQAMEEFKQQASGQYGPFAVLELSNLNGNDINKTITWLETPPFDANIWQMVSEVLLQIDKRTGLTELVYGLTGKQLRSAEEARIKNENTTIRPDEMASRVEDWLGNVAMKEIESAIWALDMQDYLPVFGELGSRVWAQNVFADENFYEKMVRNFTFRVEAGSARKPNKAQKADQLVQLGQVIAPLLQQFAMGGQIGPWNAYVYDLADAYDLPDPEAYLLQEPPQEPGADPQAELELKQAELDMKMQSEDAKLQMQREKLGMELAAKQQEMQMDAQQHAQDMEFKAAESQQDLQLKQVEAVQDIQLKKVTAQQDMQMKQQQMEMQNKQQNLQLAHKASMDQQSLKLKEQQAKAAAKNKPKPKGKK